MSTAAPDRWAHRRTEPRPFAAMWFFYLIGTALASYGLRTFVHGAPGDAARTAARVMLCLVVVGIAVAWPLIRLSQAWPQRPRRAVLLDLCVILPSLHCVAWPQAMPWMAYWSIDSVLMILGTTTLWAIIIGAIIAIAMAGGMHRRDAGVDLDAQGPPQHRWRTLWLLALLAVCLAGPILTMLMPPKAHAPWTTMLASPIGSVLELTRDRPWLPRRIGVEPAHFESLPALAWTAACLWVVAILVRTGRSPMAEAPRAA